MLYKPWFLGYAEIEYFNASCELMMYALMLALMQTSCFKPLIAVMIYIIILMEDSITSAEKNPGFCRKPLSFFHIMSSRVNPGLGHRFLVTF